MYDILHGKSLAVSENNTNLAQRKQCSLCKKRGQSAEKAGQKTEAVYQNLLDKVLAKVKRWRTSQIEKVLSARRRLVTGLRKR